MSLSLDIALKLVALLVGVIIFNKLVVPKIAELFVKKKYKNKGSNSLEQMIKLKIGELSRENLQHLPSNAGKNKNTSADLKDKILSHYRGKIENNETDDHLMFDWFLNILEELHWGESKEISEITDLVNQMAKENLPPSIISSKINLFLKDETLSFSLKKEIKKEDLANLIALHYLMEMSFKSEVPLYFKRLAKNNFCPLDLIKKSIHCVLQKSRGYPLDKIYNNIIKNISPLEKVDERKLYEIIQDFCFIKGTAYPKELKTFEIELEKEITILKAITPISWKKGEGDISKALKIFGQKEDEMNFSKVKKDYKKLLAAAHPDKISSMDLSKEILSVVHDNFIKIQDAFEEIEREAKKKRSA